MPYKVIQWATGQLGKAAIAGMIGRPDLELVGAWVHSDAKAGRDVGELAGLPAIGIPATCDKEALLRSPADCVCYMAARTWTQDPKATVAELAAILRSGKNVVNATWPALLNPEGLDSEIHTLLQAACLEGNSSFYTSGIDPGYGNLNLVLTALGLVSEIAHVHAYEIGNYASYANPDITRLLGFGQADIANCPLLAPGYVSGLFGSTVCLIAKGLGAKIDTLVEGNSVLYADEDFEVAAGPIRKGTIAGMRFSLSGVIDGKRRITLEHVTRLRETDFPEVDFAGHGYRVEVDGEPGIRLDMDISSPTGDPVHGAFVATAMAVVNAIPQVCAAPPGVVTALDLRMQPVQKFADRWPRWGSS